MPTTIIRKEQLDSRLITLGDVKHGFQTIDHSGWIILDGRLKSTLTSTQQTQATALGFGTNLPDARDKYLSQVTAGALGSLVGANSVTLAQANLPNVTLGGTAASSGAHAHSGNYISTGGSNNWVGTLGSFSLLTNTPSAGAHTHTITTNSINGGVTQTSVDNRPQTMKVNIFIYLGL